MIAHLIDQAKRHLVITTIIAIIAWLVPVFISVYAAYEAHQSNLLTELQAKSHINYTAVFYGSTTIGESRQGLCRHVILLSNSGGVGTAIYDVNVEVRLGDDLVTSKSSLTGNNMEIQYYTRPYLETDEIPLLHEVLTDNSTIRINPLFYYRLIPSGEMVELIIDTDVIGHFRPIFGADGESFGPGASGPAVELPTTGNTITVAYTFFLHDHPEGVKTKPLGCLSLGDR